MKVIQAGNGDDVLKSICHVAFGKTFRSSGGLIYAFENMNGKHLSKRDVQRWDSVW